MNTKVTSREAILAECRKLVMEQGISALNIRSVANACGVSVGSIYNYFPSKTELIGAAVEDVWRDIFHLSGKDLAFQSFSDCLLWLFHRIRAGCDKYPGFFTFHSMSFAAGEKEAGRQRMEKYFGHIKKCLRDVLETDPKVRPDAFGKDFSPDILVEFVFTLFTSMILQNQDQCKPLLEMVSRCIYPDAHPVP